MDCSRLVVLPSALLLTMAVSLPGAAQKVAKAPLSDWAHDPEVIRDFERGRELRRAGRLEEAAAAYQRVLAKAPGLATAHLNLGLVYHDQRDFASSTREFTQAVSLDPSLLAARLYLGIDAYLGGRHEVARKALEEYTRSKPEDAEAFYWLGLAQAAGNDPRAAAASLETAARLKPGDEDTLYQLQEVYLQLWKSTYDRLAAAHPESFRIHQILAEGYVQSNRLDEARREYSLVLKATPRITGVHEALGDIARRQHQLPEALQEYRKELEVSPSSPQVWYKIADVLADCGDLAQAAEAARSSIRLREDFGPAYYVLGRLAREQGRPAEAVANFEKALKLGTPGDLEERAHYQLYRLLAAAGKTREAEGHRWEYLRLENARKQRALDIAERERQDQGSDLSR